MRDITQDFEDKPGDHEFTQDFPDDVDESQIIWEPEFFYRGDCLKQLKKVPDRSVRAVICDPPYGTTLAKWDKLIDFAKLWTELNRVILPDGVIIMFAVQPFTTSLIASNRRWFKYPWIWLKTNKTGFLNVSTQPLRMYEEILVFYRRLGVFNPQMIPLDRPRWQRNAGVGSKLYKRIGSRPSVVKPERKLVTHGHPVNILACGHDPVRFHPTQKPVALLRYLIRTFSDPGDMILDPTMGSGSCAVAAVREDRCFTGIERSPKYFQIATERYQNDLEVMLHESGM